MKATHRFYLARVKRLGLLTALAGCSRAAAAPAPRVDVRPGIDVLLSDSAAIVHGRRVGLVTNMAAVDMHGVGDIARLRQARVNLVALFAPEHGLTESAGPGERVGTTVDSATQTPIYSLYGKTVAPTDAMLAGIDVMLVDLPDVGARYFTYLATTVEVMKAAGAHHIPVVILDRPNPLGGEIEGNVLDTAFTSMVGRLAVPMRHGLTLAEEARLAAADLHISVDLRIVMVSGWRRDVMFDRTGLPFRAPSPNLQSLEAVLAYPGTCLFEGTALSVGRGTDAAFLQVGAPWLDTVEVLYRLRQARLGGVEFTATTFRPHAPGDGKFADALIPGIRWHVTNARAFNSPLAAVTLLRILQDVHPEQVQIGGSFDRLAGGSALRTMLLRGDTPAQITDSWKDGVRRYRARVQPWLLYQPAV